MMPPKRLDTHVVDQAKAIRIEAVIDERGIKLKRRGHERVGPCPRCEGTDRFAINTRKQVFNCRQCGGKGVGAIGLVQFLDGVGFREACERLTGHRPASPEPPPKPEREQPDTPPAFYVYELENGTPYLGVKRTAQKDFYQQHWVGSAWVDGAPDGPKIPYRLPQLLQAEHDTVLIAEGEKDADNLAAIGFTTTTNSGGAKNWSPDLNRYFEGKDVYILPDNDEAGAKHCAQVIENLFPIAREIRVINLPGLDQKGDASDWIGAGGTADQLVELMRLAPKAGQPAEKKSTEQDKPPSSWDKATFTAEQLQGMTFPAVSWIIKDMIPAEGVTLLCSKPKFGKSWLAYDICIACTADRFTLGTIKPAQGDVLYLALEDSKRRLQKRMDKLLPTFGTKWSDRLKIATEWRHLHEGGLDDIRSWHDQTKTSGGKPIMVVVDVLAKVRKPSGNKQLYEADYEAITGLTKLANELGIAVVVIHHTRKMAADDLMETVSGSFGITGSADTILVMAAKAAGSVLDIRGRDVESAELAIQFNKDTCRWSILGTSAEVHVSDQRSRIIAALREADAPMKVTELMEATSMKRNPIDLLLGKMAKDQLILRIKMGLYAHNDYVPPPPPGRRDDPKAASVRPSQSVSKGQMAGQIQESHQPPENKEKNESICPSVSSVRASMDHERVRNYFQNGGITSPSNGSGKNQTERTDG